MGYNTNPDATGYKNDTVNQSSVRIGISGGVGSGISMRWYAKGY